MNLLRQAQNENVHLICLINSPVFLKQIIRNLYCTKHLHKEIKICTNKSDNSLRITLCRKRSKKPLLTMVSVRDGILNLAYLLLNQKEVLNQDFLSILNDKKTKFSSDLEMFMYITTIAQDLIARKFTNDSVPNELYNRIRYISQAFSKFAPALILQLKHKGAGNGTDPNTYQDETERLFNQFLERYFDAIRRDAFLMPLSLFSAFYDKLTDKKSSCKTIRNTLLKYCKDHMCRFIAEASDGHLPEPIFNEILDKLGIERRFNKNTTLTLQNTCVPCASVCEFVTVLDEATAVAEIIKTISQKHAKTKSPVNIVVVTCNREFSRIFRNVCWEKGLSPYLQTKLKETEQFKIILAFLYLLLAFWKTSNNSTCYPNPQYNINMLFRSLLSTLEELHAKAEKETERIWFSKSSGANPKLKGLREKVKNLLDTEDLQFSYLNFESEPHIYEKIFFKETIHMVERILNSVDERGKKLTWLAELIDLFESIVIKRSFDIERLVDLLIKQQQHDQTIVRHIRNTLKATKSVYENCNPQNIEHIVSVMEVAGEQEILLHRRNPGAKKTPENICIIQVDPASARYVYADYMFICGLDASFDSFPALLAPYKLVKKFKLPLPVEQKQSIAESLKSAWINTRKHLWISYAYYGDSSRDVRGMSTFLRSLLSDRKLHNVRVLNKGKMFTYVDFLSEGLAKKVVQ